MLIRHKYETDGRCFARVMGECGITGGKRMDGCGTYMCVHYKPEGCEDWVRANDDRKGLVRMFPPEEVTRCRR